MVERWFDTIMIGAMHENDTIETYKQYGQGGPGHQGQVYNISGSMVEIPEYGFNDADLNWETFNSPRFWGQLRANNHEASYYGIAINMTCHEPINFPTRTIEGNGYPDDKDLIIRTTAELAIMDKNSPCIHDQRQ